MLNACRLEVRKLGLAELTNMFFLHLVDLVCKFMEWKMWRNTNFSLLVLRCGYQDTGCSSFRRVEISFVNVIRFFMLKKKQQFYDGYLNSRSN